MINSAQTVTIDAATITGKVIVEGGTVTITNGAIIQSEIEGMAGATAILNR